MALSLSKPLSVYPVRRFLSRLSSLMTRPPLESHEALCLAPCTSLHTFFMSYDVDVGFVDRGGRVLRVVSRMRPWRVAFCPGAHAALVLRGGEAQRFQLVPDATVVNVSPCVPIVDLDAQAAPLSMVIVGGAQQQPGPRRPAVVAQR